MTSIGNTVIVAVLLLTAFACEAKIGIEYQMQLGNPSGATANSNNHEHYLIQRPVFAMDYDDEREEPNWVSWDLTAEDIGPAKRTPTFHVDTELPGNFHHAKSGDYRQSGFDRGHMCPSADRTDNSADNAAVFVMSNIIPQSKDNNEGVWEKLESDCRAMAKEGNELLITCGPVGFNGEHLPNGPELIPARTWKIVVEVPDGPGPAQSRITANTRVIAVDIPNVEGIRPDHWQKYLVSVRQIEAETGLKFFTALPENVARVLKAKVDGQPMPEIRVATSEAVAPKTEAATTAPASDQKQWIITGIVILSLILLVFIIVMVLFFKLRPKHK